MGDRNNGRIEEKFPPLAETERSPLVLIWVELVFLRRIYHAEKRGQQNTVKRQNPPKFRSQSGLQNETCETREEHYYERGQSCPQAHTPHPFADEAVRAPVLQRSQNIKKPRSISAAS